jgi:GT2 family glycosyltransferase
VFNSDEKPDYFWLLNPDTVIKPGAMGALLDHLTTSPKTGIVGGRLERMNGTVHCSAHRFHTPVSEIWERGLDLGVLNDFFLKYMVSPQASSFSHECDWVSGASCIVRREVFESIGLFDENYFLYYEDVDLCCRAKKCGWQVWYVPSSRIMHIESAFDFRRKFYSKPKYWYESRMRFFIKFYKTKGLIAADLFRFIGVILLYVQNISRKEKLRPNVKLSDLIFGDITAICSGKTFEINTGKNSKYHIDKSIPKALQA